MATAIPNLWSEDIKVDVLTPLAILRAQADLLKQQTRGLLQAEVLVSKTDQGIVRILFDLVAPALDHYRHRLLAATHHDNLVYPVSLEASYFPRQLNYEEGETDHKRIAFTESEFLGLVAGLFRSDGVKSVLQSLIARSNEVQTASSPPEDAV